MQQNKFGKKLLNWHRPFAPWQTSQRYLRQRLDRPDHVPHEAEADPLTDEEVETLLSDAYRCAVCWPHTCRDVGDQEDIDRHCLDRILQRIAPAPVIDLQGVRVLGMEEDNRLERFAAAPVPFPAGGVLLEERLAEYVTRVIKFSDNAEIVQRHLGVAIGDRGNIEVVNSVTRPREDRYYSRRWDSRLLVDRMCLFAPFWVRTPLSWDGQGGEMGLIKHLFVLHEVPAFLYRKWAEDGSVLPSKWLSWFILLGRGGSLNRAAKLFGWNINHAFAHHLLAAPAHVNPEEACVFAEVSRLGGSPLDFERLCHDLFFVRDLTEPDRAEAFLKFWGETVRWLIAHRDEITNEECNLILRWATHEYTERGRTGRKAFAWKGRRARQVVERSLQYQAELAGPVRGRQWKGHGWNWTLTDAVPGDWSFVELTSSMELFEEGCAMHHCVALYDRKCECGEVAVFSIRCHGFRRITVELNPRTKEILQAHGSCNRILTSQERSVIARWHHAVVEPAATR